jgi:hypothetical protein
MPLHARRHRLALLFAALLLLWPRLAAAQAGMIELPAYAQLLREGQTAAARGDRISLDAAAARIAAVRQVRLPDGAVLPAENGWLARELERPIPRLDLIAARLGALVEALSAPPPAAPADARARLDGILARPPFADPAAPQEPGWLDRLFDWLARALDGMARPVGEAASGAPGTVGSWALVAAGAALVAAVLAIWLRGLRRALRPAAALAPATPEARDEADARQRAAALARGGDYRGAVRLLALGALLWLDERGALRYDANQTNREHLGRLRERPELRRRLAPVVDTAERVWYGGQTLDADGYAAFERQVEGLREQPTDAP